MYINEKKIIKKTKKIKKKDKCKLGYLISQYKILTWLYYWIYLLKLNFFSIKW
jgi:hypothetical protein